MNKLIILTAIIGLAMIGGWAYLFSRPKPAATPNLPQTKVAATIYPLYDIARQVAGDAAQVHVIVPPGASPHTFQPTPQNIQNLQDSQAIFAIGHGLDDWATELAQNAKVEEVLTVDENINLLSYEEAGHDEEEGEDHGHGATDPHYWLSLLNAQTITQNIADHLSAIDPDNAALYQDNAANYIARLDYLHQQALAARENSQVTRIATFHDSWNYLARDYDLTVAATFESAAGEDPTPQELQQFQQTIEEGDIQVIFAEPQFSSQKIEAIAQDTNTRIGYLDPLGGTIDKDTYLELMRTNINQIFANR